jgi:hypothetical protein
MKQDLLATFAIAQIAARIREREEVGAGFHIQFTNRSRAIHARR